MHAANELAVAKGLAILSHFGELRDPRIERTKRHLLLDIIGLSICAVLADADGWEDIARYGVAKQEFLKTFLELPNGIPSSDTIRRLFARLDPAAFAECFASWTRALAERLGLKHVAIDGKTLRRSFDRCGGKAALHLVSAWCVENQLTLAQRAVDGKSNEITAIPELLRMLDLQGAVVTIDAMGCQKEIAREIIAAGGDYVLSVKENHPRLHEDIETHFVNLHETDFAGDTQCRHVTTREKAHGRVTRRDYYLVPVPPQLRNRDEWRGLHSIGQVISLVQCGDQEINDVRYYISSQPTKVKDFAAAVRGHWGIENSCHWVLDVVFHEDDSRVHQHHGPQNLALLRRLALSLIRRAHATGSLRGHRKRAAWNNDHLLTLLAATS